MAPQFASYPSLSGKTVFITGGASGIGEQMVRGFAAQGSSVGFVDIDTNASERLCKELGSSVTHEICDLRDIAALKSAFSAIAGRLGTGQFY